jgi:Phage shock protein A (IM30), suppresses sigma54-dependent transcription
MSFLENLMTQIKGALNDALDKASEPGRTARQVIRDLEEQIEKANASMVNVMAEYELLKQKKTQYEEEANEWHERAKKALQANREDLAKKALEQEEQAKKQADIYQKQIEALEPSINELKAKIQELKIKTRTRIKGRYPKHKVRSSKSPRKSFRNNHRYRRFSCQRKA